MIAHTPAPSFTASPAQVLKFWGHQAAILTPPPTLFYCVSYFKSSVIKVIKYCI